MSTLCLYEYPAAVRDIKGWIDFMVDNDKLCQMDWTDPERPTFGICHEPAPDGSRPVNETVYCIPLNDLVKGEYSPDFKVSKLVIFGAIRSHIVPYLMAFMDEHKGSLRV